MNKESSQKKIKTILFGAGSGAANFIANYRVEREFIAILDNNSDKSGSLYEGLPVHLPTILRELEYDEIVITTQWVEEVKVQLRDKEGVAPDKIVIPQKNQLKKPYPFENPNSLELARQVVLGLSQLGLNAGVELVVDFGTLLGIVRDGDIIPWDDDIDFAAPLGSELEIEKILRKFVQTNVHPVHWSIRKVTRNDGVCTCLLLEFSELNETYKPFTSSVSFRENVDGRSLHLPSIGMWYAPEYHFAGADSIEWRGQEILVPKDHLTYLTFQYGDWQTPVKDIQFDDYAHIQSVSFEEVKAAGIKVENLKP